MAVKPYHAIEISMRHLYIFNMTPGFVILLFRWSTDMKFSQQGKNAKKIKIRFSSLSKIAAIFFKCYDLSMISITIPFYKVKERPTVLL